MTAGKNGESTPEDDDPFGYLYADGQASGATPPSGGGGYGYPGQRSSYNQVRTVGGRQYGQQGQGGRGGGYGNPPQAQPGQGRPGGPGQDGQTAAYGQVPQQGYHQPNAHYQAPETMAGAPPRQGPPPGYDAEGGGRRSGGPNTKGLLIGALVVVAAVVIGIGAAVLTGGDGDDAKEKAGSGSGTSDTVKPSDTAPTKGKSKTVGGKLPKADAKALKLDGGTAPASDIKGAKADGGIYVGGFNQVGASATWTVSGIPTSGKYTLYVGYGVPGQDATATLSVNGTPQTTPLRLKNWANAPQGDWEKGWTRSYAYIELNKGTNTLKISCEQGNQCNANLDQVWLEKGWKQ